MITYKIQHNALFKINTVVPNRSGMRVLTEEQCLCFRQQFRQRNTSQIVSFHIHIQYFTNRQRLQKGPKYEYKFV